MASLRQAGHERGEGVVQADGPVSSTGGPAWSKEQGTNVRSEGELGGGREEARLPNLWRRGRERKERPGKGERHGRRFQGFKVVINGESWGIYVNAQQFNKDFTEDQFGSSKGDRWKTPGSPRGRGSALTPQQVEKIVNDVISRR